jgi:hypothetical protein
MRLCNVAVLRVYTALYPRTLSIFILAAVRTWNWSMFLFASNFKRTINYKVLVADHGSTSEIWKISCNKTMASAPAAFAQKSEFGNYFHFFSTGDKCNQWKSLFCFISRMYIQRSIVRSKRVICASRWLDGYLVALYKLQKLTWNGKARYSRSNFTLWPKSR